MELYLVRHGEAKPEAEDPTRPLTERGKDEVRKVAQHAARKGIRVFDIWHSGKLRAQQTAEILAEALSPAQGVKGVEGLAPLDEPAGIQEELERAEGNLMLVGHLPHLSRLAGLLLAGDAHREVVQFLPATLVALAQMEGGWAVQWILTPEIAV